MRSGAARMFQIERLVCTGESRVMALRHEGNGISADVADWSRETPRRFWDPGRKLLLTIRRYQYWRDRSGLIPALFRKSLVLRHRFWTVVAGTDIPLDSRIGGGLMIPHPNGIVIHPEARIGVNCLIFQQVTICGGVEIDDHVDIGAGAKINGDVRIGAHARIGHNAVVLKDVPSGATAVGVPARNLVKVDAISTAPVLVVSNPDPADIGSSTGSS